MPFTPTAPVFIPNFSANDMFARSPSPPRNMGSGVSLEQLPEVQMMMQMQEKVGSPAASVPLKSALKNALGSPKRDARREVREKKHVQFREVSILATVDLFWLHEIIRNANIIASSSSSLLIPTAQTNTTAAVFKSLRLPRKTYQTFSPTAQKCTRQPPSSSASASTPSRNKSD